MVDYLDVNNNYHQQIYDGYNVESFVFRPYGRILKNEFGLGGGNERLLDYGCGGGAALQFFKSKGFDVYGVDVNFKNIEICKKRMPDIADHFRVIDSEPHSEDVFFDGEFDLITAFDSLYYYSNTDIQVRLDSLNKQMSQKAIIYATMIGAQSTIYYKNSIPYKDGLRIVNIDFERDSTLEHYMNLTESEKSLHDMFSIFNKKHIGFHANKFREDEGVSFFYTYIGQKR